MATATRVRWFSWPMTQAAGAALALVVITFAALRLHAPLSIVLCWYLALVVALSFSGNALIAIAGALVATACMDYYFAGPRLAFGVADKFDALSFLLFVGIAFATTTLVARLKMRTYDLQLANAKLEKHSEALLQQAQEFARVNRIMLMGEMTASIAHEINQPLTGILSNAGTSLRYLSATQPDIDAARHYLQFIVRDGNRAAEIIKRVRRLAGRTRPAKTSFDFNEAISEVITLAQGQLNRHGARVVLELPADLPPIAGDRVQLQQVVLNLVLNAAEAMDDARLQGRTIVVVTGRVDADTIFLEVRDSGPGLRTEDSGRLFAPFFTTKPDGMGMGLAISRLIAEAHGGTLSAFANIPAGAVFRLTLPIRDPDI